MTRLAWDKPGERLYETGVSNGVLYLRDSNGDYNLGVPWNGLTAVTESPSGAESNKQYADNQVYLNLKSAEEFGATVEAFTYPLEFERCDGTANPAPGLSIGQQNRETFGFSYQTLIGNDIEGTEYGRKIHLIYGADAAPSEKANNTVNDSPEAVAFSWEVTTTPVPVAGTNPLTGKPYKPTSHITIDSTQVSQSDWQEIEELIYGTEGGDARLPSPEEIIAILSNVTVEVFPTAPTYNSATDTITIPGTVGVIYEIDGEAVAAGDIVITEDTVVTAKPAAGYKFPAVSVDEWYFDYVA